MRAISIICALGFASAPVWGQPAGGTSAADADNALAEGRKLYDLRDWDGAIAKFKEAYRLRPDAPSLFNIAQSYRLKGDCREALGFYKTYKRNFATASNADKADKFIAEMEECAKTQPVTPPPPTDTPPPPVDKPVDTRMEQPPETPPVPPASDRSWMKWTGIGAGVAGVVALGLGTKFALDGKSAASDLRDACAVSCTSAQALALEDKGEAANSKATIFFIAGGVLTAGGIVLFVLSRAGGGDEVPAVSFSPTPGGATAAYGWSF